ncbi:hypothetical protein PAEPH01_1535 [Pancytospora epiphaga]|nr:hypothetical protein PAEPH01_1535 [Pancytospora epiphaga]
MRSHSIQEIVSNENCEIGVDIRVSIGIKITVMSQIKYDIFANKLGQEYGRRTPIIPYVMTWDVVVTNYHRRYLKDIETTESYIQTIVLKKTLENISFEYRRGAECFDETEDKPVHMDVAQAYPV